MATGLNEYHDFLNEVCSNPAPFHAKPYYEAEGDSLIFYVKDRPSYAKRLNTIFTLFLSADDDSLVGCEIKGVKRLLKIYGDFMACVTEGRRKKPRLGIILGFALAPSQDDDLLKEFEPFKDVEIDSVDLALV